MLELNVLLTPTQIRLYNEARHNIFNDAFIDYDEEAED